MARWIWLCIATSFMIRCVSEDVEHVDYNLLQSNEVPKSFPSIPYPTDNTFTPERWALGKKIFYDKRISVDNTLHCGSCHQQHLGFADSLALTPGVFGRSATRNAPTLVNVAYHPYYTKEGGVPSLEMQVLIPISEHNELGFNMVKLVNKLEQDSTYQKMSRAAYGRNIDPFTITRALSTFERSLLSGSSRYDKYVQGQTSVLNEEEQQGMVLFFSDRTQCASCHNGFNFTDYSFQNNGLYVNYNDPGRFRLTGNEKDIALFKVPTLRLIAKTAPYMHDGSIKSLDEVIQHYNEGGKHHANQSQKVKPLNLTNTEKRALVAFLHTLTDESFLENKYFSR